MKRFFSIEKNKYQFDIYDITTTLTILNVILIICGFWFAPVFGLVNCGICLICNIINRAYINTYITQIMLVILNIYFLI